MLRPLEHLVAAMRLYPSTSKFVDEFRQSKSRDLPDWPSWCFIPMAGWAAIVSIDNSVQIDPGGRLPLHLAIDLGRLAAIGTWRYSQGVYQFDADFMAALADTLVVGDMPSDVLYRLPEWCIYINTPGLTWLGSLLHGYWAHLEYDINTYRSELRLLLDTDEHLIPVPVHLGPWTVTEAIDRANSEAVRQAEAHRIDFAPNKDHVQQLAASINPLISLLLYICSDVPEIDSDREPGTSPKRPQRTKTKRGWRWFPADKPRVWSVGREIGELLRTNTETVKDTGRSVKTHVRRGHWHGFWTGPRDGERRFNYQWLMPMVVGGDRE
ncbi:hypothetical protein [Methylicorpusculum sp.]|uniref:AcrVA2 family anti-CRISPR protein n=1 Tax=Methylicorpusculum sp. TaxID=2713644 RepID=UPI00271BB95F|nr:hypothetical protein [Methylicorpusculum sp.]MDO8845605.1 hypothetical protein [Methylicorpusculum sp.]